MATLTTILQLALVGLAAYLMGLAAVKVLLPADLDEGYGTLIAPTIGFLLFSLAAFTISATFSVAASTACWIGMAALGFAALATQLRPAWRLRPGALARDLRGALVLASPMALATLFPFFYLGADTYLGAVNPDFFAGLIDNQYLVEGHTVTSFTPVTKDTTYPVESAAGGIAASARFASGLFAVAIKLLLGVEMRTALSLAIAFFMLSLPLTLYFFCRVVMAFDHRQARLAAWLIGISAPTAMSYLYYYLGQNSGLPALPLVLASAYLMLTRPGPGTLILCALLSNALFVSYFAMLPYALAPAGPLALYLLATRQLPLRRAFELGAGFIAVSTVFILGNLGATLESMQMWLGVIGQSLQGSYFLDFLTEAFFPYFFGIYNYQASPWLVKLAGPDDARLLGFVVSMACLATALAFISRWTRESADRSRGIFILSALAIYTAVWVLYSFFRQYGYAVFKMSSWLQFIMVPFMAWGIHRLWQGLREGGPRPVMRVASFTGLFVCSAYVVLNSVATAHYAYNGLGRNQDTGYIVNHFGVSGNRDYLELADAVAKHVKANESVGLLFTDSIRNWWTSYYLRGVRQSMLSHELMPGEDENLPDVETGMALDYFGTLKRARSTYFHGGAADQYFLTIGSRDVNRDITSLDLGAKPLWENGSFRLYRVADVHDVLITGRGFYRLEYFKPVQAYLFPEVLRWSSQGGEFLLLRPKHPGRQYRLAFDAIVGYQHPTDSRHFELWVNGRKVQEASIQHSARFVSEPFPVQQVNRIVVRIRERNAPMPRRFVLWNRSIPTDYRRISLGFSNARIVAPDEAPPPSALKLGERVSLLRIPRVVHAFNGLQLDGWMSEGAELEMAVPDGAKALRVDGFVPGNLGFTFPYAIRASVNGRPMEHKMDVPGPFALELPLKPGEERAAVDIRPGQSRYLGDEHIRFKVVHVGARLDALTFQ